VINAPTTTLVLNFENHNQTWTKFSSKCNNYKGTKRAHWKYIYWIFGTKF